MQETYLEFQELGVNWVVVTTDEIANLRKLAEGCRYSFPLLSDPEGRVARDYGVLWAEDNHGEHNEPGVFVVRADGTLIFLGVISGPWGRPPVPDVLKIVQGAWKKAQEKKSVAG